MATVEDVKFLGIAVKHPVDVANGKIRLAEGINAVQQSIISILNTPIGSRFMLPEYGSRLHELMFEPNDEVLISMMRLFIRDAISEWEKRVTFDDAQFTISVESVEVLLSYKVLNSNEIESFIYPFYRKLKY